jgi:hypothetical protein
MVAGDIAMLEGEVTGVLKALRASGLNVVAIHHHMTGVSPMVVFLHYFGTGSAASLAKGVRAAVDVLGHGTASAHGGADAAEADEHSSSHRHIVRAVRLESSSDPD